MIVVLFSFLFNTGILLAVEVEFKGTTAPNVVFVETNTEKILYENDAYEKIYPASTTKLMTAILVVENCNLDEIVTVSENAVKSVPSGYVNANLKVGEELAVEQLLYAMLIPSANDAANALAEHIAGSIESFSSMMNTRAVELGCQNTNFTNPSGLHQKEHYTTAYDLSLIGKTAINNEEIRKILNTVSYTLPNTNKYNGRQRVFTTTNYLIRKNLTKYYYEYCIGAKTGYTEEAKNCVIAFADKDDIELTAVIMGEDANVKGKKFLEAKEMFSYIYNNYKNYDVLDKNQIVEVIEIKNATNDTKKLEVLAKEEIKILEKNDSNINHIEKQIEYSKDQAPIRKGEIVGNISYHYDGVTYQSDLVAGNEVIESKTMRNIIIILIIILLIYIIQTSKKSKKKSKRIYKKRKNKYGGEF